MYSIDFIVRLLFLVFTIYFAICIRLNICIRSHYVILKSKYFKDDFDEENDLLQVVVGMIDRIYLNPERIEKPIIEDDLDIERVRKSYRLKYIVYFLLSLFIALLISVLTIKS